jgi:raffinose/stachyose/melibiose transport system permease protein
VERIQRVVGRQITGFRCLQKVLALVLDMKLKSSAWLRAAFFIPYILSLVIVGFIWKFIFMQGFESLGHSTGWSFFQLSWLGEEGLAFFSILAVSIWQSIGFYMVIYIAGLLIPFQSIMLPSCNWPKT